MGRGIVPRARAARVEADAPAAAPDDYLSRLVKYVPSEVVAAYLALVALVPKPTPPELDSSAELWLYFVFGLIATPIYLTLTIRRGGQPVYRRQLVLSTIAFVIWAVAMGRPFADTSVVSALPRLPSALLIIATFIFPLFPPNPNEAA